tara:strand:- start:13595 stop:14014 length:420 start_codon:yes stop_codon:yes gene_type:complete
MVADRGDVNSWVQTYSGSALRGFDKTVTYSITAWVRIYLADSTYGATDKRLDGRQYTAVSNQTQRFEFVNAPDAEYNGFVDAGITAGSLMYAQDIVDTVEDCVKRTVDLIEGRIGNQNFTVNLCHASCHSSCHTSRGRR